MLDVPGIGLFHFGRFLVAKHCYQMKVITQHMQSIDCHKTTCSLAKIYLDRYLAAAGRVDNDTLVVLAISCIRLAVKVPYSLTTQFNESE